MFEFLFKRPGEKGADTQADAPAQNGQDAAGNGAPNGAADRRSAQAELARSLAGNEETAVELILNSEFADVRLAAAEHVHSQPALEKVQQAMRNTDRRVAKLMQGRIDAIRHQQAEQRQADACIAQAQRLLQDEKLTPNQVADLDRQWKVIAAAPDPAAQFQRHPRSARPPAGGAGRFAARHDRCAGCRAQADVFRRRCRSAGGTGAFCKRA
ncbi:hypothetical protein ACHMW6_22045 [Pseudoduganella sp. UC29_106]|uniref:hypothetical protein n=1 Tax=Pseudoduganella sp. UC29_106 TaxID=3374553 RepID=UPI003757E87C